MPVQHQVHHHFKVFTGNSIADVASKVHDFTANGSVAAKSIGIEYIEQSGMLVLSLGYASGQAGYPVLIRESAAGTLPENGEAAGLEAALEKAASSAGDVICHELYVDADLGVHMVFMVKG